MENKNQEQATTAKTSHTKKMTLEECYENMAAHRGNLVITDKSITELPDELYIPGSLFADSMGLESLPEKLHIEGDAFIRGNPIKSLPSDMIVEGRLAVYNELTLPHLTKWDSRIRVAIKPRTRYISAASISS